MALLHAITLDAAMSVSSALTRLARYGLWLDPKQPDAKKWIQEQAALRGLPFDEMAQRMARRQRDFGAAIRRQWYASVLWYSRSIEDVLRACTAASGSDTVLNALALHEPDSRVPVPLPAPGEVPNQEGVVLDGVTPVAVSVRREQAAALPPSQGSGYIDPGTPLARDSDDLGLGEFRTLPSELREPPPASSHIWPLLDAPDYAPARKPFKVTVGLTAAQQAHVAGGPVKLPAPASGTAAIDLTIEVVADGVEPLDGWSSPLRVELSDPTSARVTFRFYGLDPPGPEPVHVTTIEVRYVSAGAVCGTASRPLVIGPAEAPTLNVPQGIGTPWLSQRPTGSPITLGSDTHAADLTIELLKPNRDSSSGRYVCQLRSPYQLSVHMGPHPVNLGEDAKTFARQIVDSVHLWANDPLVDNMIASFGDLTAAKLPDAAIDALREVAQLVSPVPPTVLIVSAEPYVPWELVRIQPPLDRTRPPYLGAQAIVGRWLRDDATVPEPPIPPGTSASTVAPARIEKPPPEPPVQIGVRHMAVMVGVYVAEKTGFKKLPGAEKEAEELVNTYAAVPLEASSQALKQLLDARVDFGPDGLGGPDAIHFAGHGEFDASRPDASVLVLSNGKVLPSNIFRTAKYGADHEPLHEPLFFLNACMIGIGGELLGNMGGFPGNSLRGGFGALVGALWEVDDMVGRDVAIEFWRRAMPAAGRAGEPIGAILRDLRAKYAPTPTTAPVTTYLSYVYYGHPRLTLTRPD